MLPDVGGLSLSFLRTPASNHAMMHAENSDASVALSEEHGSQLHVD